MKINILPMILTIFLITVSYPIFGQQLSTGFISDFLPFSYSSSFNSITDNSYYLGFFLFSFNASKEITIGFLLERSTFNPFEPNSLSFVFIYNKDFLSITTSFKSLFQDSIDSLSPYFLIMTNIVLDFYPIFFISFEISNPLYLQNLFASLVNIPSSDTFEDISINGEFGFYLYQLSIGAIFTYETKLYNFDIANQPIAYDKLTSYDLAISIKYIPTFTVFGFCINIGYSYNDLLTTSSHYIHQLIYTRLKLIFKFLNFQIETGFGYLIYSICSSNITDLTQMVRLNYSISLSYKL